MTESYQYPKCHQKTLNFIECVCSQKNSSTSDVAYNLFENRSFRSLERQACLEKYSEWKQCVVRHYPKAFFS